MAPLPEINGRVADKYVVESLLGRGGMGSVFRARHLLTGRRVALKWITAPSLGAQLEGRILREAQAMGRIEHPNVCAILDVGEDQGAMFLVMEYLEGMSLGDWAAGRMLAPAEVIRVLFGAMAGVAAAHREGVLHRDLKLDNIFVCLDKSGAFVTTKVLDFGISKQTDPHAYEVGQITRTGQVMGTPHCMAPEQVLDEPSVDARVDIYALGVILYELFSGRLPYEADNYNRLVVAISAGPGTPLGTHCPHLDPELIAVVEKAIAHDRNARFESVDAFAEALEPFAEGARFSAPSGQFAVSSRISHTPTLTPSEMRPRSLPPPPHETLAEVTTAPEPSFPPVRPLPWGLFGMLGLLLVGVLGAALWSGDETPTSAAPAALPLGADAGRPDAALADPVPADPVPDPVPAEPDAAVPGAAMPHTTPARVRVPSAANGTPAPGVVAPEDRSITGRSGVLDPDDF